MQHEREITPKAAESQLQEVERQKLDRQHGEGKYCQVTKHKCKKAGQFNAILL